MRFADHAKAAGYISSVLDHLEAVGYICFTLNLKAKDIQQFQHKIFVST